MSDEYVSAHNVIETIDRVYAIVKEEGIGRVPRRRYWGYGYDGFWIKLPKLWKLWFGCWFKRMDLTDRSYLSLALPYDEGLRSLSPEAAQFLVSARCPAPVPVENKRYPWAVPLTFSLDLTP